MASRDPLLESIDESLSREARQFGIEFLVGRRSMVLYSADKRWKLLVPFDGNRPHLTLDEAHFASVEKAMRDEREGTEGA